MWLPTADDGLSCCRNSHVTPNSWWWIVVLPEQSCDSQQLMMDCHVPQTVNIKSTLAPHNSKPNDAPILGSSRLLLTIMVSADCCRQETDRHSSPQWSTVAAEMGPLCWESWASKSSLFNLQPGLDLTVTSHTLSATRNSACLSSGFPVHSTLFLPNPLPT